MVITGTPVPGAAAHRHEAEPGFMRRVALPVALVLVGLLIMLYPVVASQWNNFQQRETAAKYHAELSKVDPGVINQEVIRADEYNKTHSGQPILDPWLSRVAPDNAMYQEYLHQLGALPEMAQIVVPSIHVNLPVYHGSEASILEKGVGHLFGTSLPVGGVGTHAVLTGHTGLTNATLFDDLIKVKKGDVFYVNAYGRKMKYLVESTETVLPEQTESLRPVAGKDMMTLLTCTPYGINSHRYLVHGVRVPMDEDGAPDAFSAAPFQMQWWMWCVLAVVTLLLIALIWWVLMMRRRTQSGNQPSPETN